MDDESIKLRILILFEKELHDMPKNTVQSHCQ